MKKLMLLMMWLTASAAAVGLAWAGVSVVDDQVFAPPPPADLASQGAAIAPTTEPATTSSPTFAPSPTSTPPPRPTTTTSLPAQLTTSTQPPTTTTTTTTTTAATAQQPAATTTTATTTTLPQAITSTFNLTGGTTAVSFSSSRVEVLWATPHSGFSVEIEPESPGFKVEFRADHHRSRIDVWWSGGPQHSIREEPRD